MSRKRPIIIDSSEDEGEADTHMVSAISPPRPQQIPHVIGRLKPQSQNNRHAHADENVIAGVARADEYLDGVLEYRDQMVQLDHSGSPRDRYMRSLWQNRLEAFMEHALKKTKTTMPSIDDLLLFFPAMAQLAKPTPDRVPTLKWLEDAISMVNNNCAFRYPTFKLSEYDERHLKSMKSALLQSGKITNDPVRAKQWIGAMVVRQLITGFVTKAHTSGTLSWDVTLAKWLSIILVSALGCRVGDVTKSWFDEHELPYLAYQDIRITLKPGESGLCDLSAVIVIRNEKGAKDDPKDNRIALLNTLRSPKDALMDPILLLLVVALRTGQVAESSIEELLHNTSTHPNRQVIWRYPQHPVLCAFDVSGRAILVGEAASPAQLHRTLQEVTLAAGITTLLAPHDLRRGATRDVAHSKIDFRGVATTSVASSIGYEQNAANLALTAEYVGAPAVDYYSVRVEEGFVDPIYKISTSEQTYPEQKLRPTEIVQFCQENGLSEQDSNDRKKAATAIHKRRLGDWTNVATKRPRPGIRAGHEEGGQDLNECLTQVIENHVQDDGSLLNLEILTAGPAEEEEKSLLFSTGHLPFVKEYSRINVSTNYTLGTTRASGSEERVRLFELMNGNSRDKVSQFAFSCKNARFGCPHTTTISPELHRHEILCRYTSDEAAAEIAAKEAKKKAKKILPCDDCGKTFANQLSLSRHISRAHMKPRSCDHPDCDSSVVYNTFPEWMKHKESHSTFQPARCQYPQCNSKSMFQTADRYRAHLRRAHDLKGADADAYWPDEYKLARGQRSG